MSWFKTVGFAITTKTHCVPTVVLPVWTGLVIVQNTNVKPQVVQMKEIHVHINVTSKIVPIINTKISTIVVSTYVMPPIVQMKGTAVFTSAVITIVEVQNMKIWMFAYSTTVQPIAITIDIIANDVQISVDDNIV